MSSQARIFYLINHVGLIRSETKILRSLGFEIYIPNKISTHRSGGISRDFDHSLTIAGDSLHHLNGFNFYVDRWTEQIVDILNSNFQILITTPLIERSFSQALSRFKGIIVLRAYGLYDDETYDEWMNLHLGEGTLRRISSLKNRIYFAEVFDGLSLREPPVLRDRAVSLPVPVPEAWRHHENSWVGGLEQILFVCPNAVTGPYESKMYQWFKRYFGDLPHLIVGEQDVDLNDRSALGRVSDDHLLQLFRRCNVMFYPNKEIFRMHYSPVEAALIGQPVVFHADSRYDVLCGEGTIGKFRTVREARAQLKRLVSGDTRAQWEAKRSQSRIKSYFDDGRLRDVWESQLKNANLLPSQVINRKITDTEEVDYLNIRDWLREEQFYDCDSEEDFYFNQKRLPSHLSYLSGLFVRESWGRWSNGDKVTIGLSRALVGEVTIFLTLGAYQANQGAPIAVRLGDAVQRIIVNDSLEAPTRCKVVLAVTRPGSEIVIEVPYTYKMPDSEHAIGLGFISLSYKAS